jgi:hypothetical protein
MLAEIGTQPQISNPLSVFAIPLHTRIATLESRQRRTPVAVLANNLIPRDVCHQKFSLFVFTMRVAANA